MTSISESTGTKTTGSSFTDVSTSHLSTTNLNSTTSKFSDLELPDEVQRTLREAQSEHLTEKTEKTQETTGEFPKKGKKMRRKLEGEEEEVDEIIQKAFSTIIGTAKYSPLMTTDWMSKIIETVSKSLIAKEGKTRKFIVHCTISSRTKTFSICSANICSWDVERDAAYYSEWTSKTVFGAVQVFLISHRFT